MPTLTERIESDYKTAFKAGDRVRIDTLRLVKAGIQKVAMDKRKDTLDDQEVIQVLSMQAKQRKETLESAKKSNREDIVTQTNQELEILGTYLPQQLSEDAVRKLVDEAIASVGKNQGPVMKFVMGKAAGAADGKLVSRIVSEQFAK